MDVTGRTYGDLTIQDGVWYLRTEPHVTIRVKRLFPKMSPNAQGVLWVSDTLDTARDLGWLLTRWPLRMKPADRDYLDSRVDKAVTLESSVAAIQGGLRLGADDWLEPVTTPRDYQLAAADLALATGRVIVVHSLGLGKAQPLDSKVLTPTGFRNMGDLAVGDEVIAADGSVTTVEAVHEQGNLECWEVTLSDGVTIRCNDEHLWAVRHMHRRDATVMVKTLRQIIDSGIKNGWGQAKWHVPLISPPDMHSTSELPLDPYLVGALLGDGGLTVGSATFSSVDQEVIDQIAAALPPSIVMRRIGSTCDYRLVEAGAKVKRTCDCGRQAVARGLCGRCYQRATRRDERLPDKAGPPPHAMLDALRELGMWGHGAFTKQVPDRYLHASAKDRLALLQGLMDTDGYATKPGGKHRGCTTQFSSASRQLAEDTQWLARSLGGVARIKTNIKGGKPHHTVTLKLPAGVMPFRLSRKADLLRNSLAAPPTHAIVAVRQVGTEPMRCISIAHPSHLYVTDGFTTTHNTFTSLLVLRNPKARPAMAVTLGGIMPAQWVRQVHQHFPQLTATVAPTGEVTDRVLQTLLEADVVVLPYSRLAKYEPFLRGHVKTTIFDEVQELRHEGSAKYNAAASIAREADYRIGVTGTLIYGYAGETWDIAEVHDPGVLGTKTEFTREWGAVAARTGNNVSIADAGPLGAYMREIGLMDVKSKADAGLPSDAPDIQQFHIDVDPDVIDAASKDLTEIAEKLLEGGGTRQEQFGWEREMDWKMRQATGLAKAVPVAELVKLMLESERRVLLFGWHHDVYSAWGRELVKYYPVKFTGAETEVRKMANIRAFTDPHGETRVCMMSVRAGAGIDGLQQHCAALVIGELDWSPGVHQQNIGRLDRPGQTRPVFGYIATTDYGSDPAMTEVLGLKRREERSLAGVTMGTEPAKSNGDRIKLLAEAVLKRRGVL